MKLLIYVFFVLITLTSSGQSVNSDSLKIESITATSKCYFIAGSGGGFTGQVIQYFFLNDGNIYRSESLTKNYTFVKKLSRKETKEVFKKLKALQLEKMSFNYPGNMSYFIEEHKKGKVNPVKWGDRTKEVPSNISAFYKYIMDLVSNP